MTKKSSLPYCKEKQSSNHWPLMVWVSSRQEPFWPLRWLLPVIKTQKTVMTRTDVGLPGSPHGSALPPRQHVSESPPHSTSTLKTDDSESHTGKRGEDHTPCIVRMLCWWERREEEAYRLDEISKARQMHASTTAKHYARPSSGTVCWQAIND